MHRKISTTLIELREIGQVGAAIQPTPNNRAFFYLKNNQLFYKIGNTETPLSGGVNGITSLNSLITSSQNFATGTTGSDFNIVSAGSTHTFNLPNASATARGVVSTAAQSFAGLKTFLNGIDIPTGIIYSNSIPFIKFFTAPNLGIGTSVLNNNINGNHNLAIGFNVLLSLTDGLSNIALGANNLNQLTTGNDNIAIGTWCATNSADIYYNIFIGAESARNLNSGDYNIVLGAQAFYNANTCFNNIVIGANAAYNYTTGQWNLIIGDAAASALVSGDNNIILGCNAALNLIDGYNNFIVFGNFPNNSIINEAILIGRAARIYSHLSIAIGTEARAANINSNGETGLTIGAYAGDNLTSAAAGHLLIGYAAGYHLNAGLNHLLIGHSAGYYLNAGSNIVLIGRRAGFNGPGDDSLFIGNEAGFLATSSSTNNILIGKSAGHNLTTGSNNIVLGNNIALPTPTTSNYLAIGNFITGNASFINIVGRDLILETIGRKLKMQEGTNAAMGTVTLVAGSATVNTTAVNSNSRILLTVQSPDGTVGSPYVANITAGVSFTIQSTSASDTSTVFWLIIDKV